MKGDTSALNEASDVTVDLAGLAPPRAARAGSAGSNGSAPSLPTEPQVGRRRRTARRSEDERGPWYAWGPLLLAALIFGLYAIMSVARYERLDQGSWDLGIFTAAIKEYANLHAPVSTVRGPGFNLLGEHFHPIIALIAPFFRVFPSAITLLIAQALLFAISVVPIARLGIRRLGTGAGMAIGIAYGLSFGLQAAADFDFHEIVFAVPLLAFSLVALVDGRYRAAILWAIPLVLVKEDMGIMVAGIGVLIAVRGKKWWQGLSLSVFGLAASAMAVLVLIPAFNQKSEYGFWQWLGGADPNSRPGFGGAVSSLVGQFFNQADVKFQTVFLLLLATAFLALGSPVSLIAVVPLLLRFASSGVNYYGTWYHYNAPLMPILFVAAIDTLIRIRARSDRADEATQPASAGISWLRGTLLRHGAVATLAVSVALSNSFALNQYLHPQKMFTQTSANRAAWRVLALIPDGSSVEASVNLLAPLAARTDAYWIGNGDNPTPDYVAIYNAGWSKVTMAADPLQSIEQRHQGSRFSEAYRNDQDGIYLYAKVG